MDELPQDFKDATLSLGKSEKSDFDYQVIKKIRKTNEIMNDFPKEEDINEDDDEQSVFWNDI